MISAEDWHSCHSIITREETVLMYNIQQAIICSLVMGKPHYIASLFEAATRFRSAAPPPSLPLQFARHYRSSEGGQEATAQRIRFAQGVPNLDMKLSTECFELMELQKFASKRKEESKREGTR